MCFWCSTRLVGDFAWCTECDDVSRPIEECGESDVQFAANSLDVVYEALKQIRPLSHDGWVDVTKIIESAKEVLRCDRALASTTVYEVICFWCSLSVMALSSARNSVMFRTDSRH